MKEEITNTNGMKRNKSERTETFIFDRIAEKTKTKASVLLISYEIHSRKKFQCQPKSQKYA
jgi:hypothetical protein